MPLEEDRLLGPADKETEPKNEPGGSAPITNVPTEPGSSTVASQDGLSAPEIGVSWIYKLKRDELTQELQKFRLDPSGTVDEKRKRLVMFMRVGHASPQPQPVTSPFAFPPSTPFVVPTISTSAPVTAPSAPTTTAPTAPTAIASNPLDPLKIRKWNIHFNGKGDPAAFLERLDEVCEYTNFSHDQLLTVLPELLQDSALLWYRNNKRFWNSWADFVRDFRTLYFPVNYLEDLEAEIGRRLQRAGEPVNTYLTDLQTLIRRHGGMTPEQELRWLYRNLLPDYRLNIRRTDYTDIPTLSAKVKEFELLRTEVQQMYSNSSNQAVTAARLPDTTAGPKYSNTGTRPFQAARLQVPAARDRPQRSPPEPLPQPTTARLSRTGNQASAPTVRSTDQSTNICWRCGETGYYRYQCTNRRKLFCSRCGREGTMTRDCNYRRPEN